jgi:ABC-type bacteriocin/lantibiotic exporter with double-glycine peptidase domain
MTPIKQITSFTCALACIESLATDKNRPISQNALIEKYPEKCNVGKDIEGAINLNGVFEVLKDLGFAIQIVSGLGRGFLEFHKDRIPDGVFLNTTRSHDGQSEVFHFWRLKEILEDGVVVVEPSKEIPYSYMKYPWSYLQTRQCMVHVCIPPIPQSKN